MMVTTPMIAAAVGKPSSEIAATQSGEKINPAKLAPLYAVPSAAGRARTNQGDTTALIATPPIAAQPAPLTRVAANSCHGVAASAQPTMPTESKLAATVVTAGDPNGRQRG